MKHTSETFAKYKRTSTIGNNLPLAVAYTGKPKTEVSIQPRDKLEESSKYLRSPRNTRGIETTQAKIWGGR